MLRIIITFAVTVAAVWSSENHAEELVREFHGTGNTITTEFEAKAPWLLDWRVNGEYELMLAIDVNLLDARTGRQVGIIIHTKRRGNGVKLFDTSGSYKLRVDSTLAKWDLKVIELTPAEAKLYTPRKNN